MGDIGVHRRFYSNIAAHLNMVVVSPGYGSISKTLRLAGFMTKSL